MNISKQNCITLILEKFPEFLIYWEQYKKLWGNEESGFYNDMSEFSHYIIDALVRKQADTAQIREIFNFVEYLLVNGDDDVKNALSTCVLENILNQTDQIDPADFVPFLGNESREYCKAWDQFTGLKTEGLW